MTNLNNDKRFINEVAFTGKGEAEPEVPAVALELVSGVGARQRKVRHSVVWQEGSGLRIKSLGVSRQNRRKSSDRTGFEGGGVSGDQLEDPRRRGQLGQVEVGAGADVGQPGAVAANAVLRRNGLRVEGTRRAHRTFPRYHLKQKLL